MTLTTLSLLALAAGLIALAVWGVVRGTSRPEEARPEAKAAKAKRVYVRGLCPYCGEADVILRADGEPAERWHPFHVGRLETTTDPTWQTGDDLSQPANNRSEVA